MRNYNYLKSRIVYQIFPRNYSDEGTLKAVEDDLERIKALGIDIIYLLPIHPIGKLNRKGSYGSPYSIENYLEVSPDLGTLEDLVSLVEKAHSLKMKVIMDMVFNHTSRDAKLYKEHPEYYLISKGGKANRVGDWSDVMDLDLENEEVLTYLLGVLKFYRKLKVDGFRFDVCSLIPLKFFKKARKELGKKVIFIGECVEPSFIEYLHSQGYYCEEDVNLFPTFDATYNYNYLFNFMHYFEHKDQESLNRTLETIDEQEKIYPKNFLKLNCLENHDTERIAKYFSGNALKSLTAYNFFIKGATFLYAGEEYEDDVRPPLFEKRTIKRSGDKSFYNFIKKLIRIKKSKDYRKLDEFCFIKTPLKDFVLATGFAPKTRFYGLFNFSNEMQKVKIPRGKYIDLLNQSNNIINVGNNDEIDVLGPMILKQVDL